MNIDIKPNKKAESITGTKLLNTDRPDALEIINSFDRVKLILKAREDSIIISGIDIDR
jgi:hypothetical protein